MGLMTSCGSVLSLNPSYGQAEENAVVEPAPEPVVETTPVEESTPSTALLGSLLGALAGNGATESNSDGTALTTGGVVTGLLGSILNAFTSVDENGIRAVRGNVYTLYAGTHQPDEKSCALTGTQCLSLEIKR